MSLERQKSHPSELQIALDNRAFEIQLFWQRSNYFLVLITALGVGVFTIHGRIFSAIISAFATISSVYWYKTNLGSKFWQESWEVEVVALARAHKIASFERSTADIIAQVTKSLGEGANGDKSRIRRFIDRRIVSKPSVSYYMILLSVTSALIWFTITAVFLIEAISGAASERQNLEDEKHVAVKVPSKPLAGTQLETPQSAAQIQPAIPPPSHGEVSHLVRSDPAEGALAAPAPAPAQP